MRIQCLPPTRSDAMAPFLIAQVILLLAATPGPGVAMVFLVCPLERSRWNHPRCGGGAGLEGPAPTDSQSRKATLL